MKIRNIILIIILIPEFIALIIFHIKYIKQFSFQDFMSTLKEKVYLKSQEDSEEIISSFESIFGRYYDNAGLGFAIHILISLFILIIAIIELTSLTICQLINKFICCKKCCSIFLPIHCFLDMIIYLVFAFSAKYKINLENDKIYSFDDDFNKEIKENLDLMYNRKIYLIACVLVAIIGIIGQFFIIILNIKEYNNISNKNNVIMGQAQIFISSENFRKVNNIETNEKPNKSN